MDDFVALPVRLGAKSFAAGCGHHSYDSVARLAVGILLRLNEHAGASTSR